MDKQKETIGPDLLMPARLDDDLLRYAMECSGMNHPDGARQIRSIYGFLVEAARTSEDGKTRVVRQRTLQAMADCMDMVHQELVDAGVVDVSVPPMFLAEAVLTRLNVLRDETLALHRQLAAERLRADLAEQRAASKSRECIELRERMAARPPIPGTPEQAIAFIGNQCEVVWEAEQPDRWQFKLTAHDLLSAFRWWFDEPAPSDGEIYEAVSRRADPAAHAQAVAEVTDAVRTQAVRMLDDVIPFRLDQIAAGSVVDASIAAIRQALPLVRVALVDSKPVTVTEKNMQRIEDQP